MSNLIRRVRSRASQDWVATLLIAIALLLLVAVPITANSGLFGEPAGDTGTVWCGILWLRISDCKDCCDFAGVYDERVVVALLVFSAGCVKLAANSALSRLR